MTITDDELARLEALAQAATPGPWVTDADEPIAAQTHAEVCFEDDYGSHTIATEMSCADARFLMAARDAVPALVAQVYELQGGSILDKAALRRAISERDALRAENERLREEHKDCDAQMEGAMSLAETAMLNPDWTAVNPNIRDQVRGDMDALRAEAAELRTSLDNRKADVRGWEDKFVEVASLAGWSSPSDGTPADAIRRAIAERAELRASLAGAVGKIAAMQVVVEAAQRWRCGADGYVVRDLLAAVDEYEASLPGVVKVGP